MARLGLACPCPEITVGRVKAPDGLLMKILFVHPHFPGPFAALAALLTAEATHTIVALVAAQAELAATWQGVTLMACPPPRASTAGLHPWLQEAERQTLRGEAACHAALQLQAQGFTPDVIVAHPGWGDSLFLKEIWPQAQLGLYAELFYQPDSIATGFDPEFAVSGPLAGAPLRLRNLPHLLHWQDAQAAISPTQWQANTFAPALRERITVVRDGIDTAVMAPHPDISITLNGALTLTRTQEVVTFASRTLEPCRGFHVFMRSLPLLLRLRPQAHIIIAGGTEGGYGPRPDSGQSWRDLLVQELQPQMEAADWARVHFVGQIPHASLMGLLQLSSVHVYLSYPFVLGRSLLEAMSVGCAVVGSDTASVREVLQHGANAWLVNFFDIPGLAHAVAELLADAPRRQHLGAQAREWVQTHADLHQVTLPQQRQWLQTLADAAAPVPAVPQASTLLPTPATAWAGLRQSLAEVRALLAEEESQQAAAHVAEPRTSAK